MNCYCLTRRKPCIKNMESCADSKKLGSSMPAPKPSSCRPLSDVDVKMRNSELFLRSEKPVQVHIGCALEKLLLQRVLEVVDTFRGILKQCIVENFVVQVCISNEHAF